MKDASKMAGLMIGILAIWFSNPNAGAQQTLASAYISYGYQQGAGGYVCSQGGETTVKCGGDWSVPGGGGGGSGSVSGTASYGVLTANALATAYVTEINSQTDDGVNTNASLSLYGIQPAGVSFTDVLTFPNLPNGTSASLAATITLSGTMSCAESSVNGCSVYAGVVLNHNTNCDISAAGNCSAALTVAGGGQAFLGSSLDLYAAAGISGGDLGNATDSANYTAKITALTLTLASGKNCAWEKPDDECYIQTASGHKYPH
jgi:hypothetical protein